MKPDEIESGASSCRPFRCPAPGRKSRIRVEGTEPVEFAWGAYWVFGTAAYWVSQYRSRFGREPIRGQAIGHDLLEETAACILGGYGIPAEVGLAAFRRLRDAELFRMGIAVPADRFLRLLEEPIDLGRPVRYRFAYQRSCRLAGATRYFAESAPPPPGKPLELRDWLLGIPGVGPKTASWIIRNQTGSDEVAIVDVHLRRAGEAAGIFPDRWRVERDYALYERAFLGFARLGGVPASGLDALIWDEQRMMTARRRISTGLPIPERDWSWSGCQVGASRFASPMPEH
jgi:N-glycosylase/DNA lyase